jgi:hypothetical protein
MRWSEEVLLLREEMRRVLAFLQWNAEWWEEWQDGGSGTEHKEGAVAYARKQANIRRSIRVAFKDMWRGSDKFMVLGTGGDHEILELGPTAISRLSDLFQSAESGNL